jgi:hypothetical protein
MLLQLLIEPIGVPLPFSGSTAVRSPTTCLPASARTLLSVPGSSTSTSPTRPPACALPRTNKQPAMLLTDVVLLLLLGCTRAGRCSRCPGVGRAGTQAMVTLDATSPVVCVVHGCMHVVHGCMHACSGGGAAIIMLPTVWAVLLLCSCFSCSHPHCAPASLLAAASTRHAAVSRVLMSV